MFAANGFRIDARPPTKIVDANTVSLLHFDGADGATTYTDDCGLSWTNSGLSISTAQSKFGSGSLRCTGGTNRIIQSGTSTFNISGKSFTMECWFRPDRVTGGGSLENIFTMRNSSGEFCPVVVNQYNDAVGLVSSNANNSGWDINTTTSSVFTTAGAWYHVAFCADSSTSRLFVNGVQAISGQRRAWVSANYPVTVGGDAYNSCVGYVDEFRFLNGNAKYTANFTPPTLPFGL